MKTRHFSITINDVESSFFCQVVSINFRYNFNDGTCFKEVIFIHDTNEYKYSWNSSPSLGLSYLYKNGVCVYDPYKKTDQDYQMHKVANELSIKVLASFVPKSATVD